MFLIKTARKILTAGCYDVLLHRKNNRGVGGFIPFAKRAICPGLLRELIEERYAAGPQINMNIFTGFAPLGFTLDVFP